MVVNASDIRIYITDPDNASELLPIAHIKSSSLEISAKNTAVTSLDGDAMWEKDVINGFSWTLSGVSYLVMAPNVSFDFLIGIMYNGDNVDVFFYIEETEYSGTIKILNLRVTGATEQNATVSFKFKGQGKFNANES